MSLPTHLIEAVVAEITSSQGLSERSVREDVGLSDDSLSKLMQEIAERIKKREWQEDARWALEQWQNGEMQKLDTNCKYVAIYMKKFRGFGNDPTELQKRYANQFKTPQQRIFVSFIGNEDVLDVQGQS
ncbi:MAG: hypothetical protein JNL67_21755 [Planctomycetaceae bacterium]|nr:hypothetical protein [Planctomycetaceae bacterium]